MKKEKRFIGFILVAIWIFASCSSIESDAKKVASLHCEVQELAMQALQGNASIMEESQKLVEKLDNLNAEMAEKYSSVEDKQKFAAEYVKLIGDCNAFN